MKDIYKKIFCDNVKLIMEHYGYSDEKMSEIMGIGKSSFEKIKNGELPVRMSLKVVFNIERKLDIAPKKLFEKLKNTDLK